MDRRKRILVNQYEVLAHEVLTAACERNGANVFAKVRIADALELSESGLSDTDFSYGTRAHFDFVVADSDHKVQFAVELDGRHHITDEKTKQRDEQKDRISSRLGLPMLRATSRFLQQEGNFVLLGWLVDIWFLKVAFEEAQTNGTIPLDEPFCWFAFMEGDAATGKMRSLDPFIKNRVFASKSRDAGWLTSHVPTVVHDRQPTHCRMVASLPLTDGRFIAGEATVRNFFLDGAIHSSELAEELAIADAVASLRRYQAGEAEAITADILVRRTAGMVDRHG